MGYMLSNYSPPRVDKSKPGHSLSNWSRVGWFMSVPFASTVPTNGTTVWLGLYFNNSEFEFVGIFAALVMSHVLNSKFKRFSTYRNAILPSNGTGESLANIVGTCFKNFAEFALNSSLLWMLINLVGIDDDSNMVSNFTQNWHLGLWNTIISFIVSVRTKLLIDN